MKCIDNLKKAKIKSKILIAFAFLYFISAPIFAQTKKSFEAQSLYLEWQLIKNHYHDSAKFLSSITIENKSDENLPASGWKIYFNLRYHGSNLTSISPAFEIKHVNGELFYIVSTTNFKGLEPGQSAQMEFVGNGRIANYNDVPSGLFWVDDSDDQTAIALKNPHIKQVAGTEKLPAFDAEFIFNENKIIEDIPENKLPKIFPTPIEYHESSESFILDGTTSIITDTAFKKEADYLAQTTRKLIGKKAAISTGKQSGKSITLRKIDLPAEAYQLKVKPESIVIAASEAAGIFYGIQSLKSLLPDGWSTMRTSLKIPCVEVNDAPRFSFRAFMLDVSRNFQSKEEILKVLELMSMYKLNVFHFHFCDDEGWRLEIPDLPELTIIGAKRGYPFDKNQRLQPSYGSGPDADNSQGSGFYTKEDFIEILKYATERHILIIPEIESPGHARAAVKAMDARYDKFLKEGNKEEAEYYLLHDQQDQSKYMSSQYFNDNVMNPALRSTYRFIEKVVDEIQAMYKEAGAPLTMIHMGGDEVPNGVWERSPAVRALMQKDSSVKAVHDLGRNYFDRVKAILKKRNLSLYGWEELVVTQNAENSRTVIKNDDFIKDHVQVDAWWTALGEGYEDIPYRMANTGYKVVLTNVDYFYFDLAYNKSFDEPGDAWVGYLDVNKVFSFIPQDYYRNAKEDIAGNPLPHNYFKGKEQLTENGKQNITGLQGALWGENITSSQVMEYLLVPRLFALAERAWAKDPEWIKEKDSIRSQQLYQNSWSVFVNVLGKRELRKLDYYNGGYNYRIPTAGAMVNEGKVFVNIQLPGFAIHYTTDGAEPTMKSKIYTTPISDKGIIKLKVFDTRGRCSKTISVENR